ncbi:MAG: hypothetical protein M5U25_16270 [Planctomycetota bacterium]|nr:hypothetical protein [Planctomycetota bacterium]
MNREPTYGFGNGVNDEKVQVLDVTKGVLLPYQDGETAELRPLDLLIPIPTSRAATDRKRRRRGQDRAGTPRHDRVRTHGILEDITVRPNGDGKYKIAFGGTVAGARARSPVIPNCQVQGPARS